MLRNSIVPPILIATLAILAGCTESASEEALPQVQEARDAVERLADSSTDARPSVSITDLTDGCDVLTEERARALLEGAVTRHRGGACAWESGSGLIRLLYTPMPLDQFEGRGDDDEALAMIFQQVGQLEEAPTFAGEVGGGPTFAGMKDGVSVLFSLPGVNTTAVLSDRPIGQVLTILSLRTDRPHAERVQTLQELAGDAAKALIDMAHEGDAGEAAASSSQRAAPSPTTGESADQPPEASVQEPDPQQPLGTPRDDLQRFYGVYGVAGERRNFFVSEASNSAGENPVPPGYLMVGTMWGDVQPWHMKSLADTRFEQVYVGQYQDAPLVVEFHTDGDGNAAALTFSGMFEDRGRLKRIGDLPDGW